jgi:hypothetical protein
MSSWVRKVLCTLGNVKCRITSSSWLHHTFNSGRSYLRTDRLSELY